MSIRDSAGVYDQSEFADNPEARCPIVLVLDTSMYMGGPSAATLQRALVKFRDSIQEDPVTSLRADMAVVTFDDDFRVAQDFTNGRDFEPPGVRGFCYAYYAGPINLALDMIDARKEMYRENGIAYYRGLIYFLAGGAPRDSSGELRQVARRLYEAEQNRSVAFFPFVISSSFSVDEYDPDYLDGLAAYNPNYLADLTAMNARWDPRAMAELQRLSTREPVVLTNMEQLDGSIQWLSRSVAAVSQSQPGESIRLPEQDFLGF